MPSELEETYWKIEEYADYLMKAYKMVEKDGLEINDQAKYIYTASKVSYRDAIKSLKDHGLISDYNLEMGVIIP